MNHCVVLENEINQFIELVIVIDVLSHIIEFVVNPNCTCFAASEQASEIAVKKSRITREIN